MMIEQYFLMTNYSLWERLARKNELKTRGTLLMTLPDKHQLKFNTHKDAKTLMEAIEKRFGGNTETKKRNKTDLEEQSLDDLFNILKIYEAEVKSTSSASTSTQNIAFVSSSNTDNTNEPISAAASVFAISAKIHVSALLNVDTLSNAVIYSFFASQSNSPQLYNDALKQIDADNLEEMNLKWQMAMLTVRARRFLQRIGMNLRANRPTFMGFDMNGAAEPQRRSVPVKTSTSNSLVSQCDGVGSYDWSFQADEKPTNYALMAFTSSSSSSDNEVVLCSKDCTKAYATLQSHYDKLAEDYRKSQFNVISYKTGLESVEARLLVYQQNETVFEEDIKLLKLENLSDLLASQTNAKTGLGYNSQVFTHVMFDCDDYCTSESEPPSPIYDRYQSGNGYHVVPPPYTGTFMPPKPDLVFYNAPNDVETDHPAFTVELNPSKPDNDLSHTHRPSAPIIEDWVSDSEDESETKIPQNVPSFVQHTEQVKSPRLLSNCDYHEKKMAQTTARNHAQRGNHKKYARMPLSNSQRHVVPPAVLTQSKLVPITAVRPVTTVVPKTNVTRPRQAEIVAPMVNAAKSVQGKWEWKPKCPILDHGNPQHALKDKGVIDSGCSMHMTRNMSYMSDFEELNGGYVAFGGNPNGGKISGKEEHKRVHQALKDPSWIEAMQEELLQFKMQKGIDYEEVFAPVARIEAIRLFLAYASFMGFMVYQMEVKSAFLYGTIEEEVYVCQPLGFKDPDYPDKVYKVVKALYGLHQAPRAWYETLAYYLLENSFQRGKIDQTLFIKRQKCDILFVQIYVDDIIFGSTNKDLCKAFEKLMKDKFQMSSMGELTFFLGLQVKQKKDGIFINEDKYLAEILRKFGLTDGKSASTPIDTEGS
nr:putative ribonuclease H-like domain-containing protein [Tanacetum cinerariifolium]